MIRAMGDCGRCHERRELVAHGALCAGCLADLEAEADRAEELAACTP